MEKFENESNTYEIPYLHFWSDWTTIEKIKINIDEYDYFKIENRGSSGAEWWIEGYKRGNNYPINLTGHGCYLSDVVKFFDIAKHKVKTINVMHWPYTTHTDPKEIKCAALEEFWNTYAKYMIRKTKIS